MRRLILTLLLLCLFAPDADAGIFRRRRGAMLRGGGIRGMLAEARSTMAQANQTMRNAERTMRTARTMMHDPLFKESMAASERVLRLQIELEKLKAQAKSDKP